MQTDIMSNVRYALFNRCKNHSNYLSERYDLSKRIIKQLLTR